SCPTRHHCLQELITSIPPSFGALLESPGKCNHLCEAIRPSTGLDAVVYDLFGIRPARCASRPASQACLIAYAIRNGSCADAMPVSRTPPPHPTLAPRLAPVAVPTPAPPIPG